MPQFRVELDQNEWQVVLNQLASAQAASGVLIRKLSEQLTAPQVPPPQPGNGLDKQVQPRGD